MDDLFAPPGNAWRPVSPQLRRMRLLAMGTLLINLAAPLKRALGSPVVVTLQGEDLFLEGMIEPFRSEALDLVRSRIGDVDLFIAVSDYYARFMRDYLRIPESKMRVGTLGVNTSDKRRPGPTASRRSC